MNLLFGLEPALLGGFLLLVVGTFHVMLATLVTYLLVARVPTERLWIREVHKVWYLPILGSVLAGVTLVRLGKPAPIQSGGETEQRIDPNRIDWSREIRSLEDNLF